MAVDYSKYFEEGQPSPKQLLIEKCERYGAPIHADDASETSIGAYAIFRGIASESELQSRLNEKIRVWQAGLANVIMILTFFVASATLVVTLVNTEFPLSKKSFVVRG